MLGVILIGLRKFVVERLGEELWSTVQMDAGIPGRLYLPSQSYPGADLVAIVANVSRLSGMSPSLVLESFGDAVAPDLLRMYGTVVDPHWKFLDALAHAEDVIERVLQRHGETLARSPITGRVGNAGEIVLTYESRLALCPLVKGIVRGLGAHLEQPVAMDELKCMSTGARACEFAIRQERALNSERPMRRRLTPPPIQVAAVKAALLADRGDRPSSPPSLPPPSLSSPSSLPPSSRGEHGEPSSIRYTGMRPTTMPPPSGVVSSRPSSPSSVPAPSSPEPPARISELPELDWRRR